MTHHYSHGRGPIGGTGSAARSASLPSDSGLRFETRSRRLLPAAEREPPLSHSFRHDAIAAELRYPLRIDELQGVDAQEGLGVRCPTIDSKRLHYRCTKI